MLKIFLSSTYRDLAEPRSKILVSLNSVFEGVGMEKFIPEGETSHKHCIDDLKKSDIVVFLLSSNYGSLIDVCELIEECKSECPMKNGISQISYTHCEYKTTLAEGILHQTYKVLEGWDAPDMQTDSLKMKFEEEIGKEMWTGIQNIEDPQVISMIGKHLAENIVKWHTQDRLEFRKFCDREKVLHELIENVDSKVEVWGVGGVGKTALVELALLIQKLKGKRILTIGTSKMYASGSGFEDFRINCKDDQYITEFRDKITIYDIINALAEHGLLSNVEEVKKLPKVDKIEVLSKLITNEKDLILFIDDFHLASKDVVYVAKSVDHLILSSRRNTNVASKEIFLPGIDEEGRKNLIKLYSTTIPENFRELINKIAGGHPVFTELLVRNYENIDFDKIKDFQLTDANNNQVKDFYIRIIEEIFSTNKQALNLLKFLAILNTDLPTNIDRDSVLKSYNIKGIKKVFKNLVDTRMIRKRSGSDDLYELYFKHVQDYFEIDVEKESHERAIQYYEKKREILNNKYNIDDTVEVLYHKIKSNPTEELVLEIIVDEILIKKKIEPVNYGFTRLISILKELKYLVEELNKTNLLIILGNLYSELGRFIKAEHNYEEALEISKKLADKNLDVYNPNVALAQRSLGVLYDTFGWDPKAKDAYREALNIYEKLADKNPDEYNLDVARIQQSLGVLYSRNRWYGEAEHAYGESLKKYKDLAEKNPEVYNPIVAVIQNDLGIIYANLERFEKAEHAHKAALDIRIKLAVKDPDVHSPYIATTQVNLGILYAYLGRIEEAEHVYTEALEIRKKLANKNPVEYNSTLAVTLNNFGVFYYEAGKLEEAEPLYEEALKVYKELANENPDFYLHDVATAHNNLGMLYEKLGRTREEELAYQEALEIRKGLAERNPDVYNPEVATLQNDLGILYAKGGRFEEAEQIYGEALKRYKELASKNPDSYLRDVAMIWYNKACLESRRNNKEKSIQFLKEAINIDRRWIEDSKTDDCFDNIRDSQEFKELIEKEEEKPRIVVSSTPDLYAPTSSEEARVNYNKGVECFQNKDFDNAVKYYAKAISIDPNYVDAYDNLGLTYRHLGNLEKAEFYYKKSIEIYPNGILAHQNLAIVYGLKKLYDKASNEYKIMIKINPNDPEGYYGLANYYMTQGKYDLALENGKKALELYEGLNHPLIKDGQFLLGLIYYYRNDKINAKIFLKKAKDNGAQIPDQLLTEFNL